MAIDILVPTLGESVSEATVAKWYKQAGDAVKKDELIVELETDKVTLEVNAPDDGALTEVKAEEGDTVEVDQLLAVMEAGASGKESGEAPKEKAAEATSTEPKPQESKEAANVDSNAGPAARKLMAENNISENQIEGSGKDGRVTKGDVLHALNVGFGGVEAPQAGPREERVKMTRLRQAIARRLKESQNTAAILTTFNEVDMTDIMALRKQYQDNFVDRHGVKLGFMSLFTKAAIRALKELPGINAEISGDEIIYKNYYDIGIAVGTEQGLVVPVIRNADQMSFADIENEIINMAKKARAGKLSVSEMQGGTFSITNGGIYGSMLSTPIINPPQSGILGLHNIVKRPMVMPDGSIQARSMMYIALSYDHRIVDGREAVTFLVRIKEAMEDPTRLLLDV